LFDLPVTNILLSLRTINSSAQAHYCGSGFAILLIQSSGACPRDPIVMFERGPAFEPKSGFQGTILASHPKDRNPLASGFLLHPDRIQGKAAATEAFYGKGQCPFRLQTSVARPISRNLKARPQRHL
jgi:hypothetical protein